MKTKILDFDIQEFTGIDFEPEDRSVGLMGNLFRVCGIDDNGNQIGMWFSDDEFYKLCKECNKYWENYKADEEMEKEMQNLQEQK